MSSPAPSSKRRRSAVPGIVAIVVGLVVAAAAVALLTGGGEDDTASPTQTTRPTTASGDGAGSTSGASAGGVAVGTVRVVGASLPAFPESGADRAKGLAFPEIRGQDVVSGLPVTIANDGRPKIVMVVAHWCPHCQREVPVVADWLGRDPRASLVDVYAISTAVDRSRGNYPPASWLTEEGWFVQTIADDATGSAFRATGASSFPSFVAIDAQGKVVARASGELSAARFADLVVAAAGR